MHRKRTCDQPKAAFGGNKCGGVDMEEKACNQHIKCKGLQSSCLALPFVYPASFPRICGLHAVSHMSSWGGKQLGSWNLRGIVLMIVAQELGLSIFSDCIIFFVWHSLFIFIHCSVCPLLLICCLCLLLSCSVMVCSHFWPFSFLFMLSVQ